MRAPDGPSRWQALRVGSLIQSSQQLREQCGVSLIKNMKLTLRSSVTRPRPLTQEGPSPGRASLGCIRPLGIELMFRLIGWQGLGPVLSGVKRELVFL